MKKLITGCCSLTLLFLGACSTVDSGGRRTLLVREVGNELELDPVPGTVTDVWVEPMHDTIRVPGAIDPKRVYYRKIHTEVVEIRPGRFQQVEYPDDRKEKLGEGQ